MAFQLFHQNMRTFGGATTAWNKRMKKAFANVDIGYPGARVLVAGFTEIKNYLMAPASLVTMVVKLDPGLDRLMTVSVGRTAAMTKRKDPGGTPIKTYPEEYLSIAVRDEFVVQHWGKAIFLDPLGSGPSPAACYPAGVPGGMSATELPYNAKVDSRGIAYVVGQVNSVGDPLHGRRLVVAFMHNMYGVGDTSSGMMGVPNLVEAIYDKHVIDPAQVPCIVGGDFNTTPAKSGTRRSGYFRPSGEKGPDGYYLTTESHAYDWWSCRVNSLTGSTPMIWLETRKKNKPATLSDHAGISLGLHQDLWW